MLRERIVNLTSPDDVESFLSAYPTSVVFKAGTCHKTMQGFGFVQEKVEPREDLMVGVIRVVEARAASNLVAERTGIRHESPQVILFRDGQAVFDTDNWSITPEVLSDGFSKLPEGGAPVSAGSGDDSDLAPYLQVLEQYLSGAIDDRQFEFSYTTMFRDDASLRSNQEVEILNSIFGDVDQHMNMHLMMAGRGRDEKLRQRADQAYRRLQELVSASA
jgi:bacillithiol system protein YtxJ